MALCHTLQIFLSAFDGLGLESCTPAPYAKSTSAAPAKAPSAWGAEESRTPPMFGAMRVVHVIRGEPDVLAPAAE